MADRAEQTKLWTEKLLRNTEAVLTPNPGNRAEDFIFEKIEKKKPTRLSNLEYLGLDMIEVSEYIFKWQLIHFEFSYTSAQNIHSKFMSRRLVVEIYSKINHFSIASETKLLHNSTILGWW